VPCVLNIFGVILLERLGWIVGQAGVALTFLMLLIGQVVVLCTTLSCSAIATNGTIKSGGAYCNSHHGFSRKLTCVCQIYCPEFSVLNLEAVWESCSTLPICSLVLLRFLVLVRRLCLLPICLLIPAVGLFLCSQWWRCFW
jgi:hypothetical protein